MKNILVSTDFSENASKALNYAINLASPFGSKIHLVHAFYPSSRAGRLVQARDLLRKDSELRLAQIVKEKKGQLLEVGSLETKAIEGHAAPVITRYAKRIEADLIVMGNRAVSEWKEIFVGSTATAVIKSSTVPVLLIPNGFTFHQLKDISLAVDDHEITKESVIEPLISLAKKYQAHISVLHVERQKVVSGIDEGIDVFLSDTAHSFNTIHSDRIKKGIDGFVDKTDADLLCMIHRERGLLNNLFHRSVVNKEITGSAVPLLVLFDNY